MTLMQSEIYEQPQAAAQAIERNALPIAALVETLRERDIRQVVIAARGTSDHAATYAKYLLEIVCGVSVSLAAPSVYTLYDAGGESGRQSGAWHFAVGAGAGCGENAVGGAGKRRL